MRRPKPSQSDKNSEVALRHLFFLRELVAQIGISKRDNIQMKDRYNDQTRLCPCRHSRLDGL